MEHSNSQISIHLETQTVKGFAALMMAKTFESTEFLLDIKPKDVFTTNLPILETIKKNETDYRLLKMSFYDSIFNYLELYFPGTNANGVSLEFTNNLFQKYIDFNPFDLQAYINHIKFNKPDSSGHKISPAELMDAVASYIELRCDEQEKHHIEFKKQSLSEINERAKIATEKIKTPIVLGDGGNAIDEKDLNKVSEKNKYHKPKNKPDLIQREETKKRIIFGNELKNKTSSGEITETEAMTLMRDFIKTQKH